MADEKDLSLRVSQLSLQELCEKESLKLITNSTFTASDFTGLEPRLQEILFDRLRKENARLSKIEEKWVELKDCCPLVDIQTHLCNERIVMDDGEDEENGYNKREKVQGNWSYVAEDSDLRRYRVDDAATTWHSSELACKPSESDLGLFVPLSRAERLTTSYYWSSSFSHRISSQLLLYRLTVTFGMPPPRETDGYKSCWQIQLLHRDGVSILNFSEHKGAASARFYGATDTSVDALELLNFLVGMNCPHTYDGVVAGAIA